jgi:uncharacterized protein (DUF2141 family)
MKRIFVVCFIVGALLLAMSFVIAEDKCTVSGDVAYSKEANIYVCLHDQQTIREWKTLPQGSFTQKVKASPSGKASFTFKDVPKGDYLIIAFADENGNGKVDVDTWGFAQEPVWAYKQSPTSGYLNWSDQKFEVDKDITGITLK